ncbi:MAG TPA: alpha-galactosidase [Lachnospiraceae bacterium]|nr:alpha-galactosidase [Lachnospiraceae bacterium]
MIESSNQQFYLSTAHTSYWFRVTKFGHLEHVYYGPYISKQPMDALRYKHSALTGSCVDYSTEAGDEAAYNLDTMCLEWSGIGRGDYRQSPFEIKMPDGSFVNDFVFKTATTKNGVLSMDTLPGAYGTTEDCTYLDITMEEVSNQLELHLIYTVYEKTDVITRRVVLINHHEKTAVLRRALSMMLDLPSRDYRMTTFDGNWIKETHRHDREVTYGKCINSSTTGGSSNQHNPGFLLSEKMATQDTGLVYGFNLIYSGNHYGSVEMNHSDIVRVSIGIHDHCFEWELKQGEKFETPEAVMTCSDAGFNGMSHHFHDFINEHIVRGDWKGKERPVLLNNWEAHFFDFNESKLLKLAERGKKLGVELFVLDDGWFGARNNDKAGLGDYDVNRKKLPGGIKGFAKAIRSKGLACGLWFEPEMVNEDSDLYRAHPEYAITLPGKNPTYGRNQRVLDLCKPQVQDYIVEHVTKILDESGITYVKWDMNRHISEAYSDVLANQGEFFHRYTLGLYSILKRIFEPRPHILLESCSSGGNRFDLGMLCYSPQVWSSDDTDPIERLAIQEGLSYLYPLSTIGAHVSAAPHQQTLRQTPLSTRFNVAAFGCLGYELDLKYLSKVEKEEVAAQIAFYKQHRHTLQYGEFSRIDYPKDNKVQWQVREKDGSKAITGFFQTLAKASEGYDYLRVLGLKADTQYRLETKPQSIYVKRFGGLVKHLLPVELNPDGLVLRTANKYYTMKDCVESYEGDGAMLASGVMLNNQYMGTGYNENIRLLGDFGSNLYMITQSTTK